MSETDDVFEDLDAESPDTRRKALRSGDTLPPAPRRKALFHGLADPDWRVRREAIDLVVESAQFDPDLVDSLIDGLVQGDNVGLRNAALEALGRLGDVVVAALLRRLESTRGGQRKFILAAIGETRATAGTAAVSALCDDDDPNVAAAALDALALIGGPIAEAALRARLGHDDPFQRLAALDGLNRIGAKLGWIELEPALSDRFARRAAVPLLGRTGDPRAVEPLIELMSGNSKQLIATSLVALAELATDVGVQPVRAGLHERAVSAIRGALSSTEPSVRQSAAGVALAARDEESLSEVVTALSDHGISRLAVLALRGWGDEAAAPMLETATETVGAPRALALELAAELHADGSAEMRTALLAALRETDSVLAATALRGLARHATAKDAAELLLFASSDDAELHSAAAKAIRELAKRARQAVTLVLEGAELRRGTAALPELIAEFCGSSAIHQLQAGLMTDDDTVRRACVLALGSLVDREDGSVEAITLALTDESRAVRSAAAQTLGTLGSGGEALAHLLRDEHSSDVKVAVIRALGEIGDPAAIERVSAQLDDDTTAVVVETLRTLGRLGDPELAGRLVDCLGHSDHEIVKQAVHELARLPDSAAHLESVLEHPAWDVRAAAAEALGSSGARRSRATLRPMLAAEEDEVARDAIVDALERLED